MKNEPRYVPTGGGMMEVSNRTHQGRFLLKPSPEANDVILGVLGRAQRLYNVLIYCFVFLSDHYHMLVWVQDARQLARFMNYVDANIALEIGKMVRWSGSFWHGPYFSAVVERSKASQLDRLHYLLSNGCKEGLVSSPVHWPGATATSALVEGSMQLTGTWYDRTAECRARHQGKKEVFPSSETVILSPLPCFASLPLIQVQEEMSSVVRQIERETAATHQAKGTKPVGRIRILRMHPHQVPDKLKRSVAKRFLAAAGQSVRELEDAYRDFLNRYREASAKLRSGERNVEFPRGCFPPCLPFERASPLPA